MRHLVDANALIWAMDNPFNLGAAAVAAMQDTANDLLLSAATIWELSIKVGLGKLALSLPYRTWIERAIADLGLTILPIAVEYADAQIQLPNHHRDPFDRMLVAQAIVERIPVLSSDAVFDLYGLTRIWGN
jgi:PIN domain nuclease of toxin-antitoxin system